MNEDNGDGATPSFWKGATAENSHSLSLNKKVALFKYSVTSPQTLAASVVPSEIQVVSITVTTTDILRTRSQSSCKNRTILSASS